MRSFAVVAGFAAAANAYAYGYEAKNTTTAGYEASTTAAGYEASSAPAYAASSAAYTPVYTPVSPYTTTQVYKTLSTVCSEATTFTYGTKTYSVTKPTTLVDEDCVYTSTYVVKSKPVPTPAYTPVKGSATPVKGSATPVKGSAIPIYSAAKPSSAAPVYSAPPAVYYPSNGTVATATASKPAASATKSSYPEFTGAASQAGVGLLAVAGALAAFL